MHVNIVAHYIQNDISRLNVKSNEVDLMNTTIVLLVSAKAWNLKQKYTLCRKSAVRLTKKSFRQLCFSILITLVCFKT
jgi:hypothetical protein